MNRALILVGIGVGAGLMYALDPQQGHRRRALARDKLSKAVHKTGHAMGATSRDVANRASGLAASLHARFFEDNAPDDVVEARVRARLGRVASHPHSVEVSARDGEIVLRGRVPAGEIDRIVKALSAVRGVEHVEDQMEPLDGTDAQGSQGPADGQRSPADWPPAARAAIAVAGVTLTIAGVVRRDSLGMLLGGLGIPLVVRAASNVGMEELFASAARFVTPSRKRHEAATVNRGVSIPVKIGPRTEHPQWPIGGSTPGRVH